MQPRAAPSGPGSAASQPAAHTPLPAGGPTSAGSGGRSPRSAARRMAGRLGPTKGVRPASASNSITPSDHTSAHWGRGVRGGGGGGGAAAPCCSTVRMRRARKDCGVAALLRCPAWHSFQSAGYAPCCPAPPCCAAPTSLGAVAGGADQQVWSHELWGAHQACHIPVKGREEAGQPCGAWGRAVQGRAGQSVGVDTWQPFFPSCSVPEVWQGFVGTCGVHCKRDPAWRTHQSLPP